MNYRSARRLAFPALFLAVVITAFWLGFREGAKVSLMLDSIPRGGLSLFQLSKANEAPTKATVTMLESDVDTALLSAHELERHPLLPVLEPLWGLSTSHTTASLTRLANYRNVHPSPFRAEALALEAMPNTPEAAAARDELLAGARQQQEVISATVKKYAAQPAVPR
jgi:hypothetical protein